MTEPQKGPLEKVGAGAPTQDDRPATSTPTSPAADSNQSKRFDRLSGNARRRASALRSAPIGVCGCIRDPGYDRHRCADPLSERLIDGWRDAALHVLRTGHMPVLPVEAQRALWRRGGPDRVLAELLHDACGGEAA